MDSMTSVVVGSAISIAPRRLQLRRTQVVYGISGLNSISFSSQKKSFPSVRVQPASSRFRVSCAAKKETVERVCEIVKQQLALPDDVSVSGESKFSDLGVDSLDMVEIVMGLEEAFGVSVEEESAPSINAVQDAADLIEELVEAKSG